MGAPTPPTGTVPDAVRALAERLGAGTDGPVGSIFLTQRGLIRREGGLGWMRFRAGQTIATTRCAFDWNARIGPMGLIGVHDRLDGTEAALLVKAFGLVTVARNEGETTLLRGELIRYLAELPFAADAMVANPSLRWREAADGRLVVEAGADEGAATVTLELDSEGRVAAAHAADRPRAVGGGLVPPPWRGRLTAYRRPGARRLPMRAEAAWVIDGKDDIYFQGELLTFTARAKP